VKDLRQRIEETVNYLRTGADVDSRPEIAIILGTGLSALGDKIENKKAVAYGEIPNFPVSTVPGHKGELVFGKIAGRDVVVMEGRFHYYEGYSPQEITYPVRVMRALGAKFLIISNAAGGMNPYFNPGDLMIIEDHINLMGINPLIGPNDDSLGPRFPDMCEPYDKGLIAIGEQTALDQKIKVHKGVYVALTGPNLETRAEYRFLRTIGADAVGMSTVPEVIAGVHAGFRIFGISVITDKCLPDALKPVDFKEILETANRTEPVLTRLIYNMIPRIR